MAQRQQLIRNVRNIKEFLKYAFFPLASLTEKHSQDGGRTRQKISTYDKHTTCNHTHTHKGVRKGILNIKVCFMERFVRSRLTNSIRKM